MPNYSLIESKLRRYFYLGHEYSIYVPSAIRKSYWEHKHQDNVIGVRLIGKIVKKNKIEEINSIVPIILKIKKEDKLHDDDLLIYALAVCAKFNVKQYAEMVSAAYEAMPAICTDGLKLLKFIKFCSIASSILHDEGFIENMSFGFGNGFRKALNRWYLGRDPLLTTEQILRHKSYEGWTHKNVMKLIHIHSKEPSQIIFITHTMYGMEKVEELFGHRLKDVKLEDKTETFENKQLKFIYNKLKQVNDISQMDETALRYEIELRRWGHEHEVIPKNMLNSPKILTSLAMHLPLRILLDNTFFFAKQRLFRNSTPDTGLWEFILRFNNPLEVKKWRLHPIESYLQYARYSRTCQKILQIQNNILKKQGFSEINLPEDKIKVFVKKQRTKDLENNDSISQITNKTLSEKKDINTVQSTVENESKISQSEATKSEHTNTFQKSTKSTYSKSKTSKNEKSSNQTKSLVEASDQASTLNVGIQQNNSESKMETVTDDIQSKVDNVDQNQSDILVTLLKPPPKLVEQMLKFLSEDLIRKTLEVLNPPGKRILIAYDSRECMKKKMCLYSTLLSVHEAITLITLSLIYPDKVPNKPTICGLVETGKQNKNEINIDYEKSLTFASLESILFETPVTTDSKSTEDTVVADPNGVVNPLSTISWAKENNKEYDVFVFLGTNTMNLRNVKAVKKGYRAFLKKPVKIVVCCLNGKHVEQRNLGRDNMLFVAGFDKNTGKIIDSFIKEEF